MKLTFFFLFFNVLQPHQIPVVSSNSLSYLSNPFEDEVDQINETTALENLDLAKKEEEELVKNIEPIFFSNDVSVDLFHYELEVSAKSLTLNVYRPSPRLV